MLALIPYVAFHDGAGCHGRRLGPVDSIRVMITGHLREISFLLRTGGAALVLAVVVAGAVVARPQAMRTDSAFGFRPGEERRYILGPPDAVASGEVAEWWIVFDGLGEQDGTKIADFRFGHDRLELIRGALRPTDQLMSVHVEGRLRVTLDGFPMRVEFEQRFEQRGERMAQDSRRIVTFTYSEADKRFRKDVKAGTRDWDFKVSVPGYRHMDLDRPSGLYAWMPSSLGCLGTSLGMCIEADPAFANPGFLSIAMPTLFEQIDPEGDAKKVEREFMFFMPGGIPVSPFRPVVVGDWLSRERDNFSNRDRYFDTWKLELGSSTDVEVGPRTMHAWELDVGFGIDRAYVEPDGRVVRVDLEPTLHTDKRWIRLLFASEEFTAPDDPGQQCCH
ncbi:MAG TPA: hypothetical protein QGG47_10225 [Acidobacteriota bacterium]|nr:hypothetical protein [Acidobacteriota bacterium]